ncbi:growth/differentiation factor 2 [Clarias gariepinus]|uniref:growth/differentiation factor 2 n=1 Tax=Clarias gariepinus TaxID=13013 RepID=UPI00234D72F8|nr:growth/differentiation factor 2 [Clarias gariepinus]
MQGFQYLLLHLCLGLVCEGKSISQVTQQEDKKFAWRLADDRVEQDDLESLLEPLKEDFLKMLNFSGVPMEERKVQPPPFMMELYNKYASDMPSVPRSDVIRSFVIQEVTQSVISENKSSHRLLFNVSVPSYEEVIVVQLRLFMLRQRSHSACDNTSTSISIYNVVHTKAKEILHHVDRKDISDTEHSDTWEAFDVTSALQSWLQSKHGAGVLEVEVQSGGCGSSQGGSYEISLNSEDSTSPVLIVFSNDLENRKRKVKTEVQEMMTHEEETFLLSKDPVEDYNSEVHLDQSHRRKRNARKNYCRRESLKVNFKDIGWDKWIVAPPEYDAYECKGVCSFPLTDDVTPSKHAIIQTLVNLSNPKKAHRACCVPTKLDPLTVMYQENGIITVRHLYEEMKVAKCGCR